MTRRHPVDREIDLATLADVLLPLVDDGVSVLYDGDQLSVINHLGNEMDVDPELVRSVLDTHVPPPPRVRPGRQLILDLEAAVTVADLRAALLQWARAAHPVTGRPDSRSR